MTPEQIHLAKSLSHCQFLPGSYDKRFVRAMGYRAQNRPELELTKKQAGFLAKMGQRYRRQLAKITAQEETLEVR